MNARTLQAFTIALLALAGGPAASLGADEPSPDRGPAVTSEARVNINTATEAELSGLKGVGRAVAKRIVEYRQAHGEFKKPEDIRKVEGIGRRLWEQNRERIVIK
jgi:competence ComEA-like helix-hairpin-helix protein